ncbi:MAG: polyamine aminopropyltransferase [Gammaproteobacteria bacterium]|nr:polyamine aminopropyltransferase [Gammaproteobacteria bacterium]
MNKPWYNETLFEHYGQRFEIENILFENQTAHQHLVIFENKQFGRVMALDGVIQTTTRDEFIYHEMMVHVPVLAHGFAKRVLIIGGGDGGILREVLKHNTIEHVTMVEIDAAVVEMSQQYLPSISDGAFADPRLNLVIADGMDFVRKCKEKFDIIITDSTDPIGPGEILFTDDFYSHAKRCLSANGIISSQNGASFLQEWEFEGTHRRLSSLYEDSWFYLAGVPTYIGGFMTLAWATDNKAYRQLSIDTIRLRYNNQPFKTRYYNPAIHVSAFHLPQHVLDKLELVTEVA